MKKGFAERIGKAAILEALAEECAELGKAALKRARIERGDNPTPVTAEEADKMLVEEAADVQLCLAALKLSVKNNESVFNWISYKCARWEQRLEAVGK